MTCPLDTSTLRRVAVAADVDPRTVKRLVLGKRVQPSMQRRILAALVELGLDMAVDVDVMVDHRGLPLNRGPLA